MIKVETLVIDGKNYTRTYSDSGRRITRDGAVYDEAVDPAWANRKYSETNEFIDISDEEKVEAFDAFVGVP